MELTDSLYYIFVLEQVSESVEFGEVFLKSRYFDVKLFFSFNESLFNLSTLYTVPIFCHFQSPVHMIWPSVHSFKSVQSLFVKSMVKLQEEKYLVSTLK